MPSLSRHIIRISGSTRENFVGVEGGIIWLRERNDWFVDGWCHAWWQLCRDHVWRKSHTSSHLNHCQEADEKQNHNTANLALGEEGQFNCLAGIWGLERIH